jgi:hypothetical protein
MSKSNPETLIDNDPDQLDGSYESTAFVPEFDATTNAASAPAKPTYYLKAEGKRPPPRSMAQLLNNPHAAGTKPSNYEAEDLVRTAGAEVVDEFTTSLLNNIPEELAPADVVKVLGRVLITVARSIAVEAGAETEVVDKVAFGSIAAPALLESVSTAEALEELDFAAGVMQTLAMLEDFGVIVKGKPDISVVQAAATVAQERAPGADAPLTYEEKATS